MNYPGVSILELTIKAQWFDMIKTGEKRQEYREIKPYWDARLDGRQYDFVRLRNGYTRNCRVVMLECEGIHRGPGLEEWGADPHTFYWVISLGRLRYIKDWVGPLEGE